MSSTKQPYYDTYQHALKHNSQFVHDQRGEIRSRVVHLLKTTELTMAAISARVGMSKHYVNHINRLEGFIRPFGQRMTGL